MSTQAKTSFSAYCDICGRFYFPIFPSEGKELCKPCYINEMINKNFKHTPHVAPFESTVPTQGVFNNTIKHPWK